MDLPRIGSWIWFLALQEHFRVNKPSKRLLELAEAYVLRHNQEHPDDPLFVNHEGSPLICSTPRCKVIGGIIVHRGHGPGTECNDPASVQES